ncbi:MAG: acyl-CoA dehydrogenase family protein [Bdellovibrionota bacterium]
MATIWSDAFLSPEHIEIAQMARDFANKEVAPLAAEIDLKHKIPTELIEKLSALGFLGMNVDPEWGGAGLDTLSYVSALEEISVACASTSVLMSVNNSLVSNPLQKYGSPEQKKKYLTKLATGEWIGCYCLSEPGSGSDAAAMKTRAVKKEDKWKINGVKNFITNGAEAKLAVVYSNSAPELKHKGITAFLIEKEQAGYVIAKLEEKLGIRGSSTAQIIFEDILLSENFILGEVGGGFKVAMNTLDGGRIGIAAQAIGIARACLEEAAVYATEREAFGKPIASLQTIQNYIADMSVKINAARMLTRVAALKKDSGVSCTREAAEAKLFASEMCMEVAVKGVQILGGYGFTTDYPMERHFRDAKITEIYEGTSEIQRLVIAREVFKSISS